MTVGTTRRSSVQRSADRWQQRGRSKAEPMSARLRPCHSRKTNTQRTPDTTCVPADYAAFSDWRRATRATTSVMDGRTPKRAGHMRLMSVVQQGTVSGAQRDKLDALLPDLVERHLNTPPTPDRIGWNEIPTTFGYTAGKPSRSSLVQIDAAIRHRPGRAGSAHARCLQPLD